MKSCLSSSLWGAWLWAAGRARWKDRRRRVTRWNENGHKEFERTYKDGKQHGLRTEWDDNGELVK